MACAAADALAPGFGGVPGGFPAFQQPPITDHPLAQRRGSLHRYENLLLMIENAANRRAGQSDPEYSVA